jgi:hypothetical protein
MSEEVRGEEANKVAVDELQEEETVETTEAVVDEGDENKDVAEERKQALKEGLIGDSEETLDSEVSRQRVENKRNATQPTKPSTVDAFSRGGGISVGGPFARRRVRPETDKAKPAKPNNPRRGVQKIWDDEPINNVGDGTTSHDVRNKRKRGDE